MTTTPNTVKCCPKTGRQQIGDHDAIFFGAVGLPDKIPDHISLWGSLLKFRREFDQYINLRPVRLLSGVPSPLANRQPGDIDFMIVRKIPRVNILPLAEKCLPVPSVRLWCRKR